MVQKSKYDISGLLATLEALQADEGASFLESIPGDIEQINDIDHVSIILNLVSKGKYSGATDDIKTRIIACFEKQLQAIDDFKAFMVIIEKHAEVKHLLIHKMPHNFIGSLDKLNRLEPHHKKADITNHTELPEKKYTTRDVLEIANNQITKHDDDPVDFLQKHQGFLSEKIPSEEMINAIYSWLGHTRDVPGLIKLLSTEYFRLHFEFSDTLALLTKLNENEGTALYILSFAECLSFTIKSAEQLAAVLALARIACKKPVWEIELEKRYKKDIDQYKRDCEQECREIDARSSREYRYLLSYPDYLTEYNVARLDKNTRYDTENKRNLYRYLEEKALKKMETEKAKTRKIEAEKEGGTDIFRFAHSQHHNIRNCEELAKVLLLLDPSCRGMFAREQQAFWTRQMTCLTLFAAGLIEPGCQRAEERNSYLTRGIASR